MADSPTLNTDGPLGVDVKISGTALADTIGVLEVRICEGISMMPQLRLTLDNPIDFAESNRADEYASFITDWLDQPITVDFFYGTGTANNIFTGQVTHLGDLMPPGGSGRTLEESLRTLHTEIYDLQSYGVFNETERSSRTTPEFFWKNADETNSFHMVLAGGHDKLESLQRNRRCRVFAEQTYSNIITAVLGDHGFTSTVEATPDTLNFVVQYQESDYNFVLRMMKEAGLAFTVLEDGTIDIFSVNAKESDAAVWSVTAGVDLLSSALIKGRDLDLTSKVVAFDPATATVETGEAAGTDLAKDKIGSAGALSGDFVEVLPEMVDRYPTTDSLANHAKTASGVQDAYASLGLVRFVCPGNKLRPGEVVEFNTQSMLIHSVEHVLKAGDYQCIVTAGMPGQPIYTVQQPHIPRIHGPQTAIVMNNVDPHSLNYLRVQVEFRWPDASTDGSYLQSAWVRVAQPWGGLDRGTSFVPQVGDEVIVEFLNGDPSCPLITGSVYNGTNTEPYLTETGGEHKTAIKTLSNELKFYDVADEEIAELASNRMVQHSIREPASEPDTATALIKLDLDEILIQHTEKPINVTADAEAIAVTASKAIDILSETDAVNITSDSSTITIEAATSLTLKVGGNEIVIDASGVTITGTMVNIN